MTRAFGELLAYREILLILIWRDLKTRYRGSVLGFLWTFLNPLLLMIIYSLVFSVYMRVEIHAYPIFVFAGLLPWIWFSSAMLSGASSIVDSGTLIKRVPFPPQILPAVSVTAALVNFVLAVPLLLVFMVVWGLPIGWSLLMLPLSIAIQYVFTLGLTIVLSMLTVRYRDLQQLLANVLTLWFFLTPVLYPTTMVPAQFRGLLLLNPMAVLVGSFQDALYGAQIPSLWALGLVAVLALVVLGVALAVSDRMRWGLAEEI
jgi:homopolymeric O-antigen transport system permease protein